MSELVRINELQPLQLDAVIFLRLGKTGLRKVLVIFLLLFMPTICWGYALRIGNVSIPAYTEKYTTPSLNLMTDTGDVYHIPMTPQNIYGTLHVSDRNGVIYSACVGEKTRVGKYWFLGKCLVGADDDVYLESTGTQYIDTGVIRDNGIVFMLMINFLSCPRSYCMNGLRNDIQIGVSGRGMWHTYSNGDNGEHIPVVYGQWYNTEMICQNNICELYANNEFIHSEQFLGGSYGFAIGTANGDVPKFYANEKIKRVIITDDGIYIRYMIPVPAGMVIGNYTVPSNGMWDVVGQKFYGNSGTGDFIYGVDE